MARIFKTRAQAVRACRLGRVTVNGQLAKSHRHLNLQDRIELQQDEWKRILIVKELRDKPIAKDKAPTLYEDLSPPRPVRERHPFFAFFREKGKGRPTKRERREMEQLKKLH